MVLSDQVRKKAVLYHDLVNIIVLSVVFILSVIYLLEFTEWNNILTTNILAQSGNYLFTFIYNIFSSYMVFDTLLIYFYPYCVATKEPNIIILHHIIVLLLITMPLLDSRYQWHMIASLLVESNTVLLACRRNCMRNTILHTLITILFYISWVLFRLLYFPLLLYLYTYEWYLRSIYVGTGLNFLGFAPILMVVLTLLSCMWTYEMVAKGLMAREDGVNRKNT